MITLLPQEIQDKIFLYLDNYSLMITATELQSDFVKKHVEYHSLKEAASNGNLLRLKYLFSIYTSTDYRTYLIDLAARNGHLNVIRWLHENITGGCTTTAMDWAAEKGHLEIVKFLHKNRTEGFTKNEIYI